MNENESLLPLKIAVLTVSDTRTEADDKSGKILVDNLTTTGHLLAEKTIVPDNIYQIRAVVSRWVADESVQVILTTGGTGVTGRDGTPEAYVRTLDSGQLQVKVRQPSGNEQPTISFNTPLKRIINVGSVGEPRHGRPNATYVIYDTETQAVNLREVEYDYQTTCAAILDAGLPPIFAWRLARGLEFAEKADDPTHVCER
ncbi:MAG: hypothetical protein F6K08_01885 [Okeania sp. SIO1H6]|nr:hypothetical protein [Okeania sp. SIO1H6]